MRLPICDICAKTDILCKDCEKKLESGALSKADVEVSRLFKKLEQRLPMAHVDLIKSYDIENFVIIVARGKISSLIGRRGRNIKLISEKLGRRVRIVKQGDIRQMMQDLVSPARVFGINVIFSSKGEKYRVIIPDSDKRKIFMDEKTLNKAVKVLFDQEVTISFS